MPESCDFCCFIVIHLWQFIFWLRLFALKCAPLNMNCIASLINLVFETIVSLLIKEICAVQLRLINIILWPEHLKMFQGTYICVENQCPIIIYKSSKMYLIQAFWKYALHYLIIKYFILSITKEKTRSMTLHVIYLFPLFIYYFVISYFC